jgi:hypothetical protein
MNAPSQRPALQVSDEELLASVFGMDLRAIRSTGAGYIPISQDCHRGFEMRSSIAE